MPNARSSHDRPTVRGVGIAPVLAALAAIGVSGELVGASRLEVVASTACFAGIGLVEDVVGVPIRTRFALQLTSAVVALPFLLPSLSGPILWRIVFAGGCVLWIMSYVNAFNFMDGIDGISVAQTVVAGVSWYFIGLSQHADAFAAGGLIAAGAALGFAPFNVLRARVFLGDVGSYGLGALLATLLVVGLLAGISPEAVIAPVAIYLADTGSTLARRIRGGEAWYLPHRDHAYQRLVRLGWPHWRVTLTVTLWMSACAGAGALALVVRPVAVRVGGDLALVALLGVYLALPDRLAHRVTPFG